MYINQATLDAQPAILSSYLQTMKKFYEPELEKRHVAYALQSKSRLQKPGMTPQQARLAEVNVYFSEPEREREDSDSDAST